MTFQHIIPPLLVVVQLCSLWKITGGRWVFILYPIRSSPFWEPWRWMDWSSSSRSPSSSSMFIISFQSVWTWSGCVIKFSLCIPSHPSPFWEVQMDERNKSWIWIDHIVVYVAGVKVTFTRVQYASWWYWVLDFDVVLVTVSVWTMSWWSNYQAEDNELSMTVNINIGLFKTSLHFSPLQFWLILWGIF